MNYLIITILLFSLTVGAFGREETIEIKLNENYVLILTKIPFDPQKHSIRDIGNYTYIIDEKPIFGNDGHLPRFELINAQLQFDGKSVKLDTDSMFEPWFEKNIKKESFKIKYDEAGLKLSGLFSDGAGLYGAEWLIVDTVSIRTIITKDEEVLFEYF